MFMMVEKLNRVKQNWFLFLVLMIAGVTIFGVTFAQERQEKSQQELYNEETRLAEALKKGGLKEAVKIKKHYVGVYPIFHEPLLNLEKLTEKSELIVVGTPTKNRSKLTKGSFTIMTIYDVTIQQVIKGDSAQAGEAIKVAND